MPQGKYELLIFDLDGTLLDTTEGVIKSVKETVAHYGWPQLTEEQYLSFNGPPMKQSLTKWFSLDDRLADEATEYYRALYKNGNYRYAKEYDGMKETLAALERAGFLLGVATYKRTDYAIDILKHFGLSRYFRVILGDTAGSKRTKADIIRAVFEELSVAPENVLMIGDTDGDKNGAALSGIDFIGVSFGYGFHGKETREEVCIIDRPLELLGLVMGDNSCD